MTTCCSPSYKFKHTHLEQSHFVIADYLNDKQQARNQLPRKIQGETSEPPITAAGSTTSCVLAHQISTGSPITPEALVNWGEAWRMHSAVEARLWLQQYSWQPITMWGRCGNDGLNFRKPAIGREIGIRGRCGGRPWYSRSG